MFIVVLTYTVDLSEIDAALPDHAAWLDEQYADGTFVLSGRRVPRTGGVILAVRTAAEDLRHRLDRDPLNQRGYARYEVIEVEPTRAADGLALLQA